MDIDINTLRSLATVVSFLVFIGILVWAFARRNRDGFDEAANIPFDHEQ